MHFAKVYAAELEGIHAKLIEVEVDINVGLHSFSIVGLADKALSEAKERVSSALKNSGVKPPSKENRKITVNLAPADIKKTGSQYDLAIAIGYLLATEQIKHFDTENALFLGELALDGSVRSVAGSLSFALLAKKLNKIIYLPKENAKEASFVEGITIIPVETVSDLLLHLEGIKPIAAQAPSTLNAKRHYGISIADVKGQYAAKRALVIAAAGGHNILMTGTPGSGKTMLAQALNSILPNPSLRETTEISQIWSAAGMLDGSYMATRPFRAPHHTASVAAIVGGGQSPRPGEISLSHRGVLFLDELPEFRRDILEALRQPLESGSITVSRAQSTLHFPAQFILAAAMNPCPCGFYGDEEKECTCSAFEVQRYQKKISGPLLDRIDIHIKVPRVKLADLQSEKIDVLEDTQNQVLRAREIQTKRFSETPHLVVNADMNTKECIAHIALTPKADALVKSLFEKTLISARGYYRILKVSRTIADLAGSESVDAPHIAEAFGLRIKES